MIALMGPVMMTALAEVPPPHPSLSFILSLSLSPSFFLPLSAEVLPSLSLSLSFAFSLPLSAEVPLSSLYFILFLSASLTHALSHTHTHEDSHTLYLSQAADGGWGQEEEKAWAVVIRHEPQTYLCIYLYTH